MCDLDNEIYAWCNWGGGGALTMTMTPAGIYPIVNGQKIDHDHETLEIDKFRPFDHENSLIVAMVMVKFF